MRREKNKYITLFLKEFSGSEQKIVGQKPDLNQLLDVLCTLDLELLDVPFTSSGAANLEKYQVMEFCNWFEKRYGELLPELQEYCQKDRYRQPIIFQLNNAFVLEMRNSAVF